MYATRADTDKAFHKCERDANELRSCSAGGYGGAAGTGAQTGALGAGGYGAGKSSSRSFIQVYLFACLQVCQSVHLISKAIQRFSVRFYSNNNCKMLHTRVML